MKQYREKLRKTLHELEQCPVSMRTIEQTTAVLDLLCRLEEFEPDEFTPETAKAWVAKMHNADGSTGEHWTMEQTESVKSIIGANAKPCVWYAALNMMYSDYYDVAVKYNLNRPEFYAALAKAFLFDEDAPPAEDKLSAYYYCIAAPDTEKTQ